MNDFERIHITNKELYKYFKTFVLIYLAIYLNEIHKIYIKTKIMFHKYITCKIKSHNYIMNYTNNSVIDYIGFKYHCSRCYKQINESQYFFEIRCNKIKKIKRKY